MQKNPTSKAPMSFKGVASVKGTTLPNGGGRVKSKGK